MSKTVFITGATGYIGGEVLNRLLSNTDYEFDVYALVRQPEKGVKLQETTKDKVKPVIGSLQSIEKIKEYADKSDIIINTADVDDVPSAKALHDTLIKKAKPTILIHTSGTSIIGDGLQEGKKPSTKVFSDIKDIDEINSLDLEQPHRPVDEIILKIEERNPSIKTVIISPSNIVGQSNGYDKIISAQVPYLATLSVKNGQAFSVFDGHYIWSHIHIKDLGDLYALLLEKLLNGEKVPTGKEGYYFGSYFLDGDEQITELPSEIEHYWSDVASSIGKVLYQRGLVKDSEAVQLKPDEIIKLSEGDNFAPFYWGTNSRSRGDNGRKIGWKPKYSNLKYFWKTIEEDIDYMISEGLLSKEAA